MKSIVLLLGMFSFLNFNAQVGIGTPTPQRTLHVNGSLQVVNELNVGGTSSAAGSAGTAGAILVSSGAGAAPIWQVTSATKLPVTATLGAGANVSTANVYTGTTITLPPGRWVVSASMLLFLNNNNSADDFGWLRATLSDSSTTFTPSTDIVTTSKLFSGGAVRYQKYSLTTGSIIINNSSTASKTYYLTAAGEFSGTSANKFFGSFGGTAWGEDILYAIPLN
ncbi:hypothetical protein [Chryseobacterium sp.]|uniref:hypothetical protein n=1 Tax=Chryseobacterium sp. TaxID=1871047 RepID=UPI0025C120BE|nr:hypothetical protein [Chryseobacterium sp.]